MDRLLGFFSGFPNGFTCAVAGRLREELTQRDNLALIASEITNHAKVDHYAAQWNGWFNEIGLPFAAYHTIDSRMEPARARQLISEASCVVLMGGDPYQQLQFLHEYGLDEDIRESSAALLGLSAGAVNMAVRSLCVWDSPEPYEGLGLADITVHPHYPEKKDELLAACCYPVYAMEDNSAIFVKGGSISSVGNIHMIEPQEDTP